MHNRKVAVIGLGYVGLPVAANLGLINHVVGFDIDERRINELKTGNDRTNEVESTLLKRADVKFTNNIEDLKFCDFFIVAVPTPIDDAKQPDLTPVIESSKLVGKVLKKGDIVVYESTVYPGVCEEVCLPLLEKNSGLKVINDFKIGYSPERINPGDKEKTFTKITKLVSAIDEESLEIVAQVYSSAVTAGVYKVKSIKIAEAAKVIENTQRDINIALMNELSLIFDKLNIDTKSVIEAASTKWNFLPFKPGLVGGHCIGVDPYYLTYKAEQLGHHPQIILAGRKINDSMAKYIAEKTIKNMIKTGKAVKNSKVAILGLTFKENCPDQRNSKVYDIIQELLEYDVQLSVFDPYVEKENLPSQFKSYYTPINEIFDCDAIVLCVAHDFFRKFNFNDFLKMGNESSTVFIDVKSIYDDSTFASMGWHYWRL